MYFPLARSTASASYGSNNVLLRKILDQFQLGPIGFTLRKWVFQDLKGLLIEACVHPMPLALKQDKDLKPKVS
jgi:hypothetical protein